MSDHICEHCGSKQVVETLISWPDGSDDEALYCYNCGLTFFEEPEEPEDNPPRGGRGLGRGLVIAGVVAAVGIGLAALQARPLGEDPFTLHGLKSIDVRRDPRT